MNIFFTTTCSLFSFFSIFEEIINRAIITQVSPCILSNFNASLVLIMFFTFQSLFNKHLKNQFNTLLKNFLRSLIFTCNLKLNF